MAPRAHERVAPHGLNGSGERHALTVHDGGADGTPAVLAHGFGADQTMWSRLLPALTPDRTVLTFDHAGAGRSDPAAYDPARHAGLHGYAEDLLALLEDVVADRGGPVAFVGHSAGGMIGVLAAVQRPDLFTTLVLIGASPRYLDDGDYRGGFAPADVEALLAAMDSNYAPWADGLAAHVMGVEPRPELAAEFAASLHRTRKEIALEFARAIFLSDHRDVLPRLAVPTLVLQTQDDPMVPTAVAHHIHGAVAGSELVVLPSTGHFPHLSDADRTGAVVAQHLARHS